MITEDGYGSKFLGSFGAWYFRWFCNLPGKYVVTVMVDDFFIKNYDAVVDDFGNLVRVSEK